IVVGSVDVELSNPESLSQPVNLRGGLSQWQVSPAAVMLPADGLCGLRAPLDTIAPTGDMQLSWSSLPQSRGGDAASLQGRTTLEMQDMASRMTSIRPLGSYTLALDWHGQQANLLLGSVKGPLLLSGSGKIDHGRLQFSGQAEAATGYE